VQTDKSGRYKLYHEMSSVLQCLRFIIITIRDDAGKPEHRSYVYLQHDGTGRRSECRGHRRAAGEHRRIGKESTFSAKTARSNGWRFPTPSDAQEPHVNVKMDESTIEREVKNDARTSQPVIMMLSARRNRANRKGHHHTASTVATRRYKSANPTG